MNAIGEKAHAFCQRPKAGINLILAYGEDLGLVSDAIGVLTTKLRKAENNELEVVRLQEEDVKKDAALLADHLSAVSLLGTKQLFRLRISNESAAKNITSLLTDIGAGRVYPENYLCIEAPELKKTSKILTGFSSSPDAIALHFFAETQEQITDYIRSRLSDLNIQLEEDALEKFAAELPGDRRLANSEIEKLSLYAYEIGRKITADDIRDVCASEQPRGADDAADAALAGDVKRANTSLDRFLDAGGSAISALRTLHFRLIRILDAKLGARYLRPPVFDKEKPAFNKMLQDWNASRVNRALAILYAAEKSCKQSGVSTEAILKIVIDRISRRQV
ncbi:DNA polymerase III subunit delta [Hirschia litorea]|uniref:DNA-directed DNA polymerase n=1 Tax=Hirschia litorea TaxID=1199156 RepID=A0ABW2IN66_9PROT